MSRPKEFCAPLISSHLELPLIVDTTAREVARFFLSHNNGHQRFVVQPEPDKFEWRVDANTTRSTGPDLKVVDLQYGKEMYLETTTGEIHAQLLRTRVAREDESGNSIFEDREEQVIVDPKARQKEVMKNAAPDVKYVVWYRSTLLAVQEANPGYNFFNGHDWKNVKNGK